MSLSITPAGVPSIVSSTPSLVDLNRRPRGPRSMSWRKPVPALADDVIPSLASEEPKSKRQSWNFPWFAVEPQPPLPNEWQEKIERVHVEDEIRGSSKATRPTLVRHASTSAFIRPGTDAPRPNLSRRYVSASSLPATTIVHPAHPSASHSSAVPRPPLGRQTSGLSLASSGGSSLLTMASVNEARIIARGERRRGMVIPSEYDAVRYEDSERSSSDREDDTASQYDERQGQSQDHSGRTGRPLTSTFGPRISTSSREPASKAVTEADAAARQPIRKLGWLRKLACHISCCGTSRNQDLEA